MDNKQNLKKIKLKIQGMHCASCEILIERNFKQIPGVEKVNVNQFDGKAKVYCSRIPPLQEFQAAVRKDGYNVIPWEEQINITEEEKPNYGELGVIFLIVVVSYLMLKEMRLLPQLSISENMSIGFIFLIGLVAAFSTCIAVTGGLLLAVAAKYNEQNPYLERFQKFKPHIFFNLGRIASYTLLGGLVGLLGSALTLSSKMNGTVTILASFVMLILGFQMLKLFPQLSRLQLKMPKFIGHKIHDLTNSENKAGSFLLGASTFFLPCGFTQALQLYVLSTGSFTKGALTMLVFSLGTLPALLSLGTISSFAKGRFQYYLVRFAGVIVILLGVFNIGNGLNLADLNINVLGIFQRNGVQTTDQNVQMVDGKQIAKMQISGLSYTPSRFTVTQGVPVEWQIDAKDAAGCAQVIIVPKLGIIKDLLRQEITTIEFTPQELGEFRFFCSMGMTTPGSAFVVVSKT